MNIEITEVQNGFLVRRSNNHRGSGSPYQDPVYVYRTVAEIQDDLQNLLSNDDVSASSGSAIPKPQ